MPEEQRAEHIENALAEIKQQLSTRDDRIAELEKRLENQEYSVRSVLDMLIEWLEDEHQTPADRSRDAA